MLIDIGKNSIVRADKIMSIGTYKERPPPGPHSRVYNNDMDRVFWKVRIIHADDKCCFLYVPGMDEVGEVNDIYLGVDGVYDTFHNSDKWVIIPEVGCQGYKRPMRH